MRWVRLPLLGLLLLCGCSALETWPIQKFDSASWKASPEGERYKFVRDLIATESLRDKTRSEVINLLGPTTDSTSTSLHYLVKLGGSGFDKVFVLDVRFEGHKVKEVLVRGD